MIRWNKKILPKLKKLRLTFQMYLRYVDDTLIVVDSIIPGVRFDPKKNILKFCEDQVEADLLMEDDARTFSVLRQIADSIDRDIQWEEDIPSGHPTGKLPCLDLEIWSEEN